MTVPDMHVTAVPLETLIATAERDSDKTDVFDLNGETWIAYQSRTNGTRALVEKNRKLFLYDAPDRKPIDALIEYYSKEAAVLEAQREFQTAGSFLTKINDLSERGMDRFTLIGFGSALAQVGVGGTIGNHLVDSNLVDGELVLIGMALIAISTPLTLGVTYFAVRNSAKERQYRATQRAQLREAREQFAQKETAFNDYLKEHNAYVGNDAYLRLGLVKQKPILKAIDLIATEEIVPLAREEAS